MVNSGAKHCPLLMIVKDVNGLLRIVLPVVSGMTIGNGFNKQTITSIVNKQYFVVLHDYDHGHVPLTGNAWQWLIMVDKG